MISITPPVGTPAYRRYQSWTPPYHEKVAWRLKKAGQWVSKVLIGCRHKHVTLPYNERQVCLDCGAWRHYVPNSIYSTSNSPMFIGRWKRADSPASTACVLAEMPAFQLVVDASINVLEFSTTPHESPEADLSGGKAVR